MTRMSGPVVVKSLMTDSNPLESWRGLSLARAVHAAWRVVQVPAAMLALSILVGCVIPPSLTSGDDAGVNSPPAIMSVTSDQQALPEPGPVVFDVGPTAGDVSVSLIDTDTMDTLYVRIFVDYNLPNQLDARAKCTAPPNMKPIRTATCHLNALCQSVDIGVQRAMTVVVFDRPLLDPGEGDPGAPPFQTMAPGGLSTKVFYFLKCQPGQT